jgi:hypothetical protein
VWLEKTFEGDGESEGVGEEDDGEDEVEDKGGEEDEQVADMEEGGDGAVSKTESFCLLVS